MLGRNRSNHRARHRQYYRSCSPSPALAWRAVGPWRKWQRSTPSGCICKSRNSGKRLGQTRWAFGPMATNQSAGALNRDDRDLLLKPSRSSCSSREANMDEDRVAGTARKLGGRVQEEVGRFTGDAQAQLKGMANQAAGTAQDLYGQAADAARDTATTLDKWLRNTIETQPYTTAIVALGIGWLLGRMHRPL